MKKHVLIDATGREFYWYSAKFNPLYNVEDAASAWHGRTLIYCWKAPQ